METGPYEDEGPSVAGSYAHGWETLKAQPGRLLLILFLFLVLQLPGSADIGDYGIITSLYQLLVVGPVTFGISYCFLVAVRGREPEVGDLFAPFQRSYGSAVLAAFLMPVAIMVAAAPAVGAGAIAMLGETPSVPFLLLAVLLIALPVFAAVRLSFVPYLLVEEGYGPVEVLGESWSRTQPVQLQIFFVELLSAPLLLAGMLLFLVGVFPAMILAGLAMATIYDDVAPEDPDEEDDDTTTPAPTAA